MPNTAFDPSTHGFKFDNHFEHQVGAITFYGACGGMCYAALDYYHCLVNTPTHRDGDFGGLKVPPPASRLAQYIWKRQFDSTVGSWHASKHWALSWNPDDNALKHWSTNDEWTKLKQFIDAGSPIALGLINFGGAFWTNHQVVAYGYDDSNNSKVIHVYDPNHHDTNVTLTFTGKYWRASHGGSDDADPKKNGHWRGWFVESAYQVEGPTYQDLVLIDGLDVPSTVMIPELVGAGFMVKNIGEFTAHADQLSVVDSKSGVPVFPVDNNQDVAPGSVRQYWRAFTTVAPATHMLSPAYKCSGSQWKIPPPANTGASDNAFLRIVATDPARLETFIRISSQKGHDLAEPTLGKKLGETSGTVAFPAGRPFGITDLQSLSIKYEVTEWTLFGFVEVEAGSYGHAATDPRKITWAIDGSLPGGALIKHSTDNSSFTIKLKPKQTPYRLEATVTGANGNAVTVARELSLKDTYTDNTALAGAMARAEKAMQDMLKELMQGGIDLGGGRDPLPGPRGIVPFARARGITAVRR